MCQRSHAACRVDQVNCFGDGIGAWLGGSHTQQMHAGAGGRSAQHAAFEHAEDQRGPTRVAVAIAIEVLTDELATYAANRLKYLVDVARHQVLCPEQSGLERGVAAVDEVAQDVDRSRSFP